MKLLIAIDPGTSGGLAILAPNRIPPIGACAMPETMGDICRTFEASIVHANGAGSIRAYIERVSGFAGENHPGSAMFNFGEGYGAIQGMLMALKIPFELVSPQTWQKALGVGTMGRVKANFMGLSSEQIKAEKARVAKLNYIASRDWKNRLKATAQQLYPDMVVTLKTSDCLLILEYARRRELMAPAQSPQKELVL